MAEVTYWFTHYYYLGDLCVTYWTADPAWMVNPNLFQYASTSTNNCIELVDGNNCPGDDLGTITKVELRVYGYGDANDRIDLTPVFGGITDGSEYQTTPGTEGVWSTYIDITNDGNAPDWSSWSHIEDLDCKVKRVTVSKANTMHCAKVEARVTYEEAAPPVAVLDKSYGAII